MWTYRLFLTQLIDKGRAAATDLLRQFGELAAGQVPATSAAAAFALGTVVSTVPVPFLDMALGAAVLRHSAGRLPRLPIVAAMAIWNNLVMAPLYMMTPRLGAAALGAVGQGELAAAVLPGVLAGYLIIVGLLSAVAYGVMWLGLGVLRRLRMARPGGGRAAFPWPIPGRRLTMLRG